MKTIVRQLISCTGATLMLFALVCTQPATNSGSNTTKNELVNTVSVASWRRIKDTSAPSVPQNVAAQAISPTKIIISWSPSTDNVGVSRYAIYRNGATTALMQLTSTSFTDISVTAGSEYRYTVKAIDAAGNSSALSLAAIVITPLPADTSPPTTPLGLAGAATGTTGVSLTWSPSIDNVGVIAYSVYRNGLLVGSVGITTFTDANLLAGTTYSYTVKAVDAAGNTSSTSAPAAVTTQSAAVISGGSSSTVPFSSISSTPFYVDPNSDTVYNANNYIASHGADAGMQRLTQQPLPVWLGSWTPNVQAAVNNYVTAATAAGKMPMLVAYNIPNLNCTGGGAVSASAYQSWIASVAAGIGSRHAIVILEPDAVAASCYDSSRAAMLSQAITTFASSSAATVYLDGGNAAWTSAAVVGPRMLQSGVAAASGFSINISNFQTNAASISYGTTLSQLIGGKHFVIDTSRNGLGPTADNAECNPAGRGLGVLPTTATGNGLVDAFLWIKIPGESDGQCGPSINGIAPPPAGSWWNEYALMLVRNAGW